jgi:hypothetical protein
MANLDANNSGNANNLSEGTLIANGPMAISESARVRARYGENAVPGGTQMVDFNARVTFNDTGHLTINTPTGDVGGNPRDVLFRLIMNRDGDQIAANVGNSLLESRGDIITSIGYGSSGELQGFGLNSNVTLTPSVRSELMENIQLNFDIQMTQKVLDWCRDNPNGAAIRVGERVVAYDPAMVEDLRNNAMDRLQNLVFPDQQRSATPGDTVVASANDRSTGTDTPTLVAGNAQVNRQFEQALQGTNGDPNAAALAVDTIRNASGYKEGQDISVVQGKNGNFVVSQGQGDAALNLAVPQARQGDFERVSSQVAQAPQPQPIAQQLDQPERTRTPTV